MKVLFCSLLAMGLAFSLKAADNAAPSAPPSFAPPAAPGAEAQGSDQSVSPSASDNSDNGDEGEKLAAPELSEEQMIENDYSVAMDLYHAEDYKNTAQTTQHTLDRYPKRDLYKVRYLNALSLEHDAQYKDAIYNYKIIVKKHPNTTWGNAAEFRMGVCYGKLEDVPEAVNTFRDIIDYNPRSEYRIQAFIHLGNLYRHEGQWKPAAHIYQDILRLYPCTEWATLSYQYLGEAYAHQGEDDKAIRVYRRSEADPCTPRTFAAQAELRIADIYMAHEEYPKALKLYMAAALEYRDVAGVELYANERIELAKQGRSQSKDFDFRRRSIEMGQPSDEP